jgi:hypothetical protein
MDLGVRFDVADKHVAKQFRKAMAFWSNVLDVSFHDETGTGCAIAIVDAAPGLLEEKGDVARSQFPLDEGFQGWIAIDPHVREYMNGDDIYSVAAHELGHLFGLRHNPSAYSLMYFLDCDGTTRLDSQDLRALAASHALKPVPVSKHTLQPEVNAASLNQQFILNGLRGRK